MAEIIQMQPEFIKNSFLEIDQLDLKIKNLTRTLIEQVEILKNSDQSEKILPDNAQVQDISNQAQSHFQKYREFLRTFFGASCQESWFRS